MAFRLFSIEVKLFTIKIADLIISIDNKYDFVRSFCKEYICDSATCDFQASATEEEISKEKTALGSNASDGFIESVCIYRSIAKRLPHYNAFVFHAAAIEFNGKAYCFTAKSGTGKTTHINLWRKYIGDKVNVINGDKPIIRFIDKIPYAFGTPWSGKENYNNDIHYPLKSICFINQAQSNSINKLDTHKGLSRILHQIYLPANSDDLQLTIDLIDKLFNNVALWELNCDISEEAALLCFNTLTNEANNEH